MPHWVSCICICRGFGSSSTLQTTRKLGLPSAWSNFSELTDFSNDNSEELGSVGHLPVLTGTLPASWAALTKSSVLILIETSLSGSLPMECSNMTQLAEAYLSGNRLSGSVPESWGGLTQLRYVALLDDTYQQNVSNMVISQHIVCLGLL